MLIDRTNAAHGPADVGVAMSALILAQVSVAVPAAMATDLSGPARALLTSFLARTGAVSRPVARRGGQAPGRPDDEPAELDQLDAARWP